jgi:putative nucleotidyltransferase with HDIG domain
VPGATASDLLLLPPQPAAAELVLSVLDEDADADSSRIAAAVELDPGLAARVIRLANATSYGSTRVGSVAQAVRRLGAESVKALAVGAACAVLDESFEPIAPGFWLHAITSAAATAVIGERRHVPVSDAFTVGLLHDIGQVLLERRNPALFATTQRPESGLMSDLLASELAAFGVTHAQAGADALAAWGFPTVFVEAVAHHHGAVPPESALGRVLRAGHALALTIEPADDHLDGNDLSFLHNAFRDISIPVHAIPRIADQVEAEVLRLIAPLGLSGDHGVGRGAAA